MARSSTVVRSAVPSDLATLIALWQQLRDEGPRRSGRFAPSPSMDQAQARLIMLMDDPSARLVVAETEGEVVGMALFRVTTTSTLLETNAVEVSNLCVNSGHRRSGIGRSLVAAAASYADDMGVEHLIVSVFPAHREANRFWARLGFGPVAVRRMTTLSALRRVLPAQADSRVGPSMHPRRGPIRRRRGVPTSAGRPL